MPKSKKKNPPKADSPKAKKIDPQVELERDKKYFAELEKVKSGSKKEEVVSEEPVAPDNRKKMVTAIIVIMAVVFIGWLLTEKYRWVSDSNPEQKAAAAEWQSLRDTLGQAVTNVKESISQIKKIKEVQNQANGEKELSQEDVLKLKIALVNEATKTWAVYNNFDYNFSIKHPTDWQEVATGKGGVTFTKGKDKIVATIALQIPRPALPEDKSEVFFLDTLSGRLYHDTAAKDGTPLDKVIATLPDGKNDIYIAGYGSVFDQMILTFKLIK